MNPFERANRRDKVKQLVLTLERLATQAGASLDRMQTYRRLAVHAYEHMTAKDWYVLAVEAKVTTPSDATVREVVDQLVAIGIARAYARAHSGAQA